MKIRCLQSPSESLLMGRRVEEVVGQYCNKMMNFISYGCKCEYTVTRTEFPYFCELRSWNGNGAIFIAVNSDWFHSFQ